MGVLRREVFDRKTGALLRTEYIPTELEPDTRAATVAIAKILVQQLKGGNAP